MSSKRVLLIPRIDGEPHRPWASINVRREDKLRFDLLVAWWAAEAGPLSHWDGFSLMMAMLVENGEFPSALRERLAKIRDEL